MAADTKRWELTASQDFKKLQRESKQFKGESLWTDAWRRLRRTRSAFWSLLFLLGFALISFLAPILPLPSPKALDTSEGGALPPTWPWTAPTVAADWDPAVRENDADIAPGVLPTRTVSGL